MASAKVLRHHQRLAFLDLGAHLIQTDDHVVGLVGDPGSGKTLLVSVLAAYLTKSPSRFRAAVILVPNNTILRGFLDQGVVQFGTVEQEIDDASENRGCLFTIPDIDLDEEVWTLHEGSGGDKYEDVFAHIHPESRPRRPILVTTIHRFAEVFKRKRKDLQDLSHVLLFYDEGHHVPFVESEDDEEGKKRNPKLWGKTRDRAEKLGATSFLVSATLYRNNGEVVVPDLIQGPDGTYRETKIHRFSKADLIDAGLAPSEISVEIRYLDIEDDDGKQLTDGKLGVGAARQISDEAIDQALASWKSDGSPRSGPPKAIFRTRRKTQAERVADRFENQDGVARLYGHNYEEGFLKVMRDRETEVDGRPKRFEELETSVVVGCRRVEEGFDWPPCTHVYNFGLIHSPVTLDQLHGRTSRDKSRYVGYPEELVQKSVLVQLIPKVTAEGAKRMMADTAMRETLLLAAATLSDVRAATRFLALGSTVKKHLKSTVKGWKDEVKTSQLQLEADAEVSKRISAIALSLGNPEASDFQVRLWNAVIDDCQANPHWWTIRRRIAAHVSIMARLFPTDKEVATDPKMAAQRAEIESLLKSLLHELRDSPPKEYVPGPEKDPESLEVARALAKVIAKVIGKYKLLSSYGEIQDNMATILNMNSTAMRALQQAVDGVAQYHPNSWQEGYVAYRKARIASLQRSNKTDMSKFLGQSPGTYRICDFDRDLKLRRFKDQPEIIGSVSDIVRETGE